VRVRDQRHASGVEETHTRCVDDVCAFLSNLEGRSTWNVHKLEHSGKIRYGVLQTFYSSFTGVLPTSSFGPSNFRLRLLCTGKLDTQHLYKRREIEEIREESEVEVHGKGRHMTGTQRLQ
jgi:hypothetical protein